MKLRVGWIQFRLGWMDEVYRVGWIQFRLGWMDEVYRVGWMSLSMIKGFQSKMDEFRV